MTIIINGTNTPTAGTVGIGNGTDLAFTAQGTVGQVLTSNGTSAPTWETVDALPSQTGNNGKYLTTNGSTASWGTLPTTNLATGVTGTLPVANGGTGLTSVGTNGQVLSSNGSNLTWTTPSAGAMTLISTQTANSSSALSWTNLSGYQNYMLVVSNILASSGSNTFRIYLGFGSTPTYITSSSYRTNGVGYGGQAGSSGLRFVDSSTAYTSFIPSGESVVQGMEPIYGTFTFYRFSSSAGYTGQLGYTNSSTGNYSVMNSSGKLTSGTYPITALSVSMASGTMSSGTISLYGISS